MAGSINKFTPSSVTTSASVQLDTKGARAPGKPSSAAHQGALGLQGLGTPQVSKLEPEAPHDTKDLGARRVQIPPADVAPGRRSAPASAFDSARMSMAKTLGPDRGLVTLYNQHERRPVTYLGPEVTRCATALITQAARGGSGTSAEKFNGTVSGVMQAIHDATTNMRDGSSQVYRAAIAHWSAALAQDLSSDQRMALGFALAAHQFSPLEAGADGPTGADRDLAAGVQLAKDPVAALCGQPDHSQAQTDMLRCLFRMPSPKQAAVHKAIESLETTEPTAHVRALMVDFALVQRQRGNVDAEHHDQLLRSLASSDADFVGRDASNWRALRTADEAGTPDALSAFHKNYEQSELAVVTRDGIPQDLAYLKKMGLKKLDGSDSQTYLSIRDQLPHLVGKLAQQVEQLQVHLLSATRPEHLSAIRMVADGVRKSGESLLAAAQVLTSIPDDRASAKQLHGAIIDALRSLREVTDARNGIDRKSMPA